MRFLKKIGLALFSMMLFCGVSVTAFASSQNVWTDAYVDDNNSDIVAEIRSEDGRERAFRIYATYYDYKNREIGNYHIGDDEKSESTKVTWTYCRDDWDHVNVRMFSNGKLVRNKTIRRIAFDEKNVYMTCYVDDDNNILADIKYKNGYEAKYRVKLTCKDRDGNEVYSDIMRGDGGGEIGLAWTAVPQTWRTATLQYRIGDKLYTLGLTKVNR